MSTTWPSPRSITTSPTPAQPAYELAPPGAGGVDEEVLDDRPSVVQDGITRKINALAPVLDAWLAADARLNASVIHERLVAEHGL